FTTEDLTKQVTINAGGLYSSMTADELKTVTHLKITGTIDARDFKTMRESMGRISEIDIRDANILAYTGSDGTLFEWATYEANAIPTEAFYFRNGAWTKNWFSKILFPTSLTKIGYFAFAYSGLRSITLHEGITRIGGWAFHGCMLNTIALPASLTTIEDWALGANTILSSFTVAPGNPNFSTINGCLYDKSAKTLLYWPNTLSNQAIIPEGTETIWTGAFQGCDFINFINIPTSLKNIVAPAFVWTSNMWRFEVTEANPYFSTIDGVLYDKSKKKLLAYPNQKGTNYDIPNGVTEIGIDAFGGCWNLTSVNIPTSVTKISNNAFYSTAISRLVLPASINTIEAEAFSNCGNLKAITVNWKYPVDISNAPEVFSGMDKSTCALRVPQGTTGNYRSAAQWGEFNFIDEIQSVTYHVRVPAETKACYIAGEMNGWGQQPMIKENNNVYSITLNAYLSDQYKYFSGPDWSYEEMDTAHNVINNRDFSPMDTVRTWLNVYQPLMPYSPWNIQSNPWFSIGKIQFVSETEGWVTCGGDNSLLHSTDGGLIWNKVVPFPNDHSGNYSDPAISMDWVNPSHGWAIKTLGTDSTTNYDSPNGAVMYSTSDGGGSWARKALPKTESTITYNDADLQGVWQVHEIFEGNYQNLETFYSAWGHLKLTVGTNGQCLLSDNVFSSGSWSGSTAEMHVASNGVISMKDTNLKGFLNMDKNTGIFTIENETSSNVFGVMQRQVPNVVYQTSDLAGTWQMHMLNVDNPQDAYSGNSGWVYAIATVDVTGNAQLNIVTNNGDINSANTQFSITSDGFVSMAGMDWHGFMNADKTAYYSTFTNDGGKSYALCVMQKQKPALTYDVTELEGSWVLHEIMVANTNLMNPEGRINVSKVTIQKDGSGILTSIQNRNNDDNVELKLAITSSGLVSEASGSFRGFLNADKNTLTYTRNDPAGYAFGVLQRDSSYSGDVGLQVQFADENTGWASTFNWKSNGFRLYRSINGGTDWNLVPGPRSVCIFDFVDANNGWAISGFPLDTSSVTTWSIEHTTDGGLNWTTQYSETVSSDYSFNALQFTDLNNGWITGDNGKLLKTVDGGLHWTPVTIPGRIMNSKSKALFFLDANTGWITDENKMDNTLSILHTTDGGANWTTQNTNLKDGSLVSLYFWDVNHGWFTGEVTMDFGGNMINQGIIGRLFDGGVEIGPIKSKNTVSIYPNPVKDGFYIRSVEPGSMVTIYNLNGTAVLKQIAEDECYVDVKDLKKGMYLVRISNSSGVINKKIVKL
ncbi:MAG: leucine-rich repeat protein, partial [Bacteroidia bacterium]|nr:leucine-rich repeat protein [Bacteroidia bacterium]